MIYLIVFIYLFILSIFFDFLNVKGPKKFFYYLSMIILILIAGLRWKVGGDTLNYQHKFEMFVYPIFEFNKMKFLQIGWETGFVLLLSICKTIVNEFWFFQMVLAIFSNVLLFRFFKLYTPYYFTAVLFYSYFYYFYFNMEILREIIPICIFITWMYPSLEKGNLKKYYLINAILLLFHTSAIILFLFPLLSKFKLNKKGFIILSLIFILFTSIFIIFPNIINILSFNERIASKLDTYSKYSFSLNGMIYLFLIFGCFPYFIVKFNKKYFKEIYFEKLIFPYFFIITIYIAYSGFGRFINYFGPFMLVFLINTIYLIMHVKIFKEVRSLMIFILIIGPILYKYQLYNADTSMYYLNTKKVNLWYPYSNVFDKKEYQFRQIIFQESMLNTVEKTKK